MKSNDYYIQGIAKNQLPVLNDIYADFGPTINNLVKRNSGNDDDAQDVFQEALIVIFNKVSKNDLALTAAFGTYLYSVARLIWLKKLKNKSKIEVTFSDVEEYTYVDQEEEGLDKSEKALLYHHYFKKISSECQKMLIHTFNRLTGEQIAKMMGYSIEYVKRKRYKCKSQLIDLIRNDPKFIEIKSW